MEHADAPAPTNGQATSFLRRVIGPTGLIAAGIAIGAALARMPVRNPAVIASMRSRSPMRAGGGGGFLAQFLFGSLTWYACALSCPLFIWLARRFPLSRRHWRSAVTAHALALIAMVLLTASAYYLINAPGGDFPVSLLPFVRSRLVADALPFLAMIAAIHAFEFRRRERAREAETTALNAQLAQSRLDVLTAQLQPHFLFNTLQGISTLMHRDVAAAEAMLQQLSDLLRRALLRSDRRHEIPLAEELEMLRDYVAICRQRFGDRLTFDVDVDPVLLTAMVPFFLLQPLVENALEHGIANRSGPGHVSAAAHDRGGVLELRVTDNGRGVVDGGPGGPDEGIGLSNTRSRLRALYREDQELRLEPLPGGGTQVIIRIPLRHAAAEPHLEAGAQ